MPEMIMVNKILIFILFALFGLGLTQSTVFADTTNCSNSTGELRFYFFRYDGGAPPPSWMVIRRETWFYKGDMLGEKTFAVDGTTVEMDLVAEFDPSSYLMLDSNHSGSETLGRIIYAQKVSLGRPSGGAVYPDRPDTKEVSEYMICTKTFFTIPPP